jgi:hypothetical protein
MQAGLRERLCFLVSSTVRYSVENGRCDVLELSRYEPRCDLARTTRAFRRIAGFRLRRYGAGGFRAFRESVGGLLAWWCLLLAWMLIGEGGLRVAL